MKLLGYADRLSVAPGDRLRVMVSCEAPEYEAAVVRLIHGDTAPASPGFKEEVVETAVDGRYPGRRQVARAGSYVRVPDAESLRLRGSFTIQTWVYPTTPAKGAVQGLVARWAPGRAAGYALLLDEEGELALWLGDGSGAVERIRSGAPLRARAWHFVACCYDAELGRVALRQEPLHRLPSDPAPARVEQETTLHALDAEPGPLLAAAWLEGDGAPSGLYNGKLEGPRVFERALASGELERLREGAEPEALGGLVAAWDFSQKTASRRVVDRGPHRLDGETVQAPTRAVTGHDWSGRELCFRNAPEEYGAIHFHDDDLEDAGWEADFELTVAELRSGVYAVRLRCEGGEAYAPFAVRPPRGTATAPVAVLMPTMTYVAYANERQYWHSEHLWLPREGWPPPSAEEAYLNEHPEVGLSLYDLHSDGSGCCYSSRLRPILNMGPKYRSWLTRAPRHFAADLYLVDWLEEKGYAYDVVTDEDLNEEGRALLEPYRVVITGSHPEYLTERMHVALEEYLEGGGRLMYLGGNGFYWVTSVDPERPHLIEVRRGAAGTRSWEGAPGEGYHSTTGEPGGLWRYRGRAPQRLVAVGFAAEGWDRGAGYVRGPGSFREEVAFVFEGVGEDEVIGDFGLALGAAAADEVDRLDFALGSPPNTILLASSAPLSDYYQFVIEDLLAVMPGQGGTENGDVRADMTYTEWPNGGAVFSVGSISWAGSLSHGGYENNVSRITENILRRFFE